MPAPGKGVDKSKKKTIIKGQKKTTKKDVILNLFQDLALFLISKSGEIPNHYNRTPYYNPTGRGQVVKAAVWNDTLVKENV